MEVDTTIPAASSTHVTSKRFPSVIERYYTEKFALDVGGEGQDQYIYCHTNGLLVVGLAPSHPIIVERKTVTSVTFQSEHRDFTKNVVRGSKKKGGARLRPDGVLAQITCSDGTEYVARPCVDGNLLEVNSQLATKPELLTFMPATQGYLALVQPLFGDKTTSDHLMSLQDYRLKRFPEQSDNKPTGLF